jgi:hypothetical protein
MFPIRKRSRCVCSVIARSVVYLNFSIFCAFRKFLSASAQRNFFLAALPSESASSSHLGPDFSPHSMHFVLEELLTNDLTSVLLHNSASH